MEYINEPNVKKSRKKDKSFIFLISYGAKNIIYFGDTILFFQLFRIEFEIKTLLFHSTNLIKKIVELLTMKNEIRF
jgi:hypothetical protein